MISSQIPVALKQATVAIEDKRFYSHHGVDPISVARAALTDLRAGHVVQGASTIEMQYVKNAYLGGQGDSLARKIREAVLAWQLDTVWSKDRILTAYLNTVYYGSGAYGVEAASQTFFHKHVWQLSLPECALLAALPRLPNGYSPVTDPEDALARRDLVLQQMRQQGYITAPQAAAAAATKLDVYDHPPQPWRGPAAYFVQYVTQQLVQRYGTQATFEGGLRVTTSLDLRMQRDAVDGAVEHAAEGAGRGARLHRSRDRLRARHGRHDRLQDVPVQPRLAGAAAARLGDEAVRPHGGRPAGREPRRPPTTRRSLCTSTSGRDASPPYWDVSTFSNTYAGRINLVQATWQSDNTVYAQLALDVGPQNIVSVAHRMGITSPLQPYPSIVLGTELVNPLEVADAYATFAAEGIRHQPQAIAKVVFPNGRVDAPPITAQRAIPAGAAYVVDKILEGNTRYGTAAAMPIVLLGRRRRQDGHDHELGRRLVLRLQPQARDGRSGWGIRRARSRCPACRGRRTPCPPGASTTRWSSARSPCPTSRNRRRCRSGCRGRARSARAEPFAERRTDADLGSVSESGAVAKQLAFAKQLAEPDPVTEPIPLARGRTAFTIVHGRLHTLVPRETQML